MKKNYFELLFSVFFVFYLFPAAAISSPTDSLVGLIKSRYDDLQNFQASFEQTLTHKESGLKETKQGNLHFRKPMLARWQTKSPHAETLVITRKEIWDYFPEEEIVYRYPVGLVQDSRSILQVITGQSALSKDFDIKNKGNENGLTRLLLYPHEPTTQMVEANIWVEPGSGFIKRAQIIDFYGNSNDVKFLSFSPESKIPEEVFTFSPPKGIEVEDRVDNPVQEKDLFK